MKINLNKSIKRIAEEEQKRAEQKQADRILFYILLSMQIVFKEQKFTQAKRKQLTDKIISKSNEISQILTSNKCIEGKQEVYDVDTNLELLRRLAEQNNVEFDETIFN